jgi:tripartite-type tricarboxylate transporter receptor subunit TctC
MDVPFTLGRHFLVLGMALAVNAHGAEAYPTKPIRIIVHASAGGALDVTTRLVAQRMSETLGQAIVVDNRPGGEGLVGIRAAKSAPPDGYTLLATASTIAVLPSLLKEPNFDLMKDFTGVGPMVRSPMMMLVGPNQPEKSIQDFVTRAKAHPGQLSYGSAGLGSPPHIGAAIFLQQSGLAVLHVPYKGNAAAIPDVIGGRLDMIFESPVSGSSHVRAGKLRALGVSSTSRLPSMPAVPTIAEQGFPGFSYYFWLGLLAPTGTPTDIVQKLNLAVRNAATSKDLTERFRSEGSEPYTMSPQEFNAFLKRDLDEMTRLTGELKIPKQ